MPPKKKYYYYTPETKAYYVRLKELANSCGRLASKKSLLFNLDEAVVNPECIRTLQYYYYGDKGRLADSIKKKEKELRDTDWRRFLRASDNAGIKRDAGDRRYERFFELMARSEEDCDLRARVHDWCNAELEKIERGEPTVLPPLEVEGRELIRPQSVPELMARYDKLLANRAKRQRKQ
ncbi:hypothetical protein IIY67_01100 [Candidatus Saccharibacteria bacterium]|nr:hypothetical protein [Candidatus Saccharibacteria bacterium]